MTDCKFWMVPFLLTPVFASDWGYNGANGPSSWPDTWPMCGDSYRQSPIDIDPDLLQHDAGLGPFMFTGYDNVAQKTFVLKNNGHAVQIELQGPYAMIGGGLTDSYGLQQLHFHWGDDNKTGSEHTIGQQQYPMEMHMVHWNTDIYTSTDEIESEVKGQAVLGFMMEIVPEPHKVFQKIVDNLHRIPYKGDEVLLSPFNLTDLMSDTSVYYRYLGSLTTPPCYINKVWTIFKDTIKVSEEQMEAFRTMLFTQPAVVAPNRQMMNNFRPMQPIGGRTVYTNMAHAVVPGIYFMTSLYIFAAAVHVIQNRFY